MVLQMIHEANNSERCNVIYSSIYSNNSDPVADSYLKEFSAYQSLYQQQTISNACFTSIAGFAKFTNLSYLCEFHGFPVIAANLTISS